MEISPAHALILIIADRKVKTNNQEELARLKKILLVGVNNDMDKEYFNSLLKDPVLSGHNVSNEPIVIDNCKVRRFFETVLCYETLKESITTLDAVKLEGFYENLMGMHTKYYYEKFPSRDTKSLEEYLNTKPKEYTDNHFKIDNEPRIVEQFDEVQRKKLHQLVESCIRSVLCTQTVGLKEELPKFSGVFENNNYFSESRRMQRTLVKRNIILPSSNFGLVFGITDLGAVGTPILRCKFVYNYIKPVEKATYKADHNWARFVFPILMHPFSNGASGTILGQLKLLYYFGNHDATKTETQKNEDQQFVKDYIKNLICIMLFLGGGHSLYEFIYPLSIKDVHDSLKDFIGDNEITFEELFLDGNAPAFERTLDLTEAFSKQVIAQGPSLFDFIYGEHINDMALCTKIDRLCKVTPHLVTERATTKQWTPLQLAVVKRMPYTLRTLVKHELKESHPGRDKDLNAALALAKDQGDNYPIALLFLATLGIESLGKINAPLANGKTPYEMAVENGSMRVQTSLKRLGAKVDYKL